MPQQTQADKQFIDRALEAAIRIGLLITLLAWCFQVVRPFIIPLVWGVIIAIATYPGYNWLQSALGKRRRLAAILFTLLGLILVIAPTLMLSGTLVASAKALASQLSEGTLAIPPPPASVSSWPAIGKPLDQFWSLASSNIQAALHEIEPEIKLVGTWLLSTAAGAGYGILQFVVAIIIAGVLMVRAEGGNRFALTVAARLAGERGQEFADLAETTVRNVARGILGVALIQSLLAGLGFLVAGVPGAGLWALLCLLLGVAQIGITPILIPVVIYLFYTADMVTAVAFLIWSVPVGLLDNILKPILMGRGSKTPMVVVFIGAIGGFLASGIIGLFIGSVILALSYELFIAWVGADEKPQSGMNTHV